MFDVTEPFVNEQSSKRGMITSLPAWLIHLGLVFICYSSLVAAMKLVALQLVDMPLSANIHEFVLKCTRFPEYFNSILDFGSPLVLYALYSFFKNRVSGTELPGSRILLSRTRWLLVSMLLLCVTELALAIVFKLNFATDKVVISQTLLTISMVFSLIVQVLTFMLGLSMVKTFATDEQVRPLSNIVLIIGSLELLFLIAILLFEVVRGVYYVSVLYYLALFGLYVLFGKKVCAILTPGYRFSPLTGFDIIYTSIIFVLLIFVIAV